MENLVNSAPSYPAPSPSSHIPSYSPPASPSSAQTSPPPSPTPTTITISSTSSPPASPQPPASPASSATTEEWMPTPYPGTEPPRPYYEYNQTGDIILEWWPVVRQPGLEWRPVKEQKAAGPRWMCTCKCACQADE